MSAPNDRAYIEVQEATEQNLRALSCAIPRSQLTVVTGPSGSGKSSLVFGVLYREALGQKPRNALAVSGLPPTVAIGHELRVRKARGTVATASGIYDLLRALYLREGSQRCPRCGSPIELHSTDSILESLRTVSNSFISVLTPRPLTAPGAIEALVDRGLSRGWVNGRITRLADIEPDSLGVSTWVIDDLITPQARGREPRLRESIARAIDAGAASIAFGVSDSLEGEGSVRNFALKPLCGGCGAAFEPIGSEQFEFWRSSGACAVCAGTGVLAADGLELDGLSYLPETPCAHCGGTRVREDVGAIELLGRALRSVLSGSLAALLPWASELRARFDSGLTAKIAAPLVARLELLSQLGVDYLPLSRDLATLSGGELQRLRLGVDLSKPLSGILYLIDEPTTGLHARDTARVVDACRALVAKGSTIIAVEHDPDFISAAEYVLELGPGAGIHGGALVAAAPIDEFRAGSTATAMALRRVVARSEQRRRGAGESEIVICNLHRYSLQHIDLHLPLHRLVAVAGVSGSGKSTAIQKTVVPLIEYLLRNRSESGEALSEEAKQLFKVDSIRGVSQIEAVVDASQIRPYLGSRSTVASAAGVLTPLRELFARTIDARAAGMTARDFSFFSPMGWCEQCEGRGVSAEGRVDAALAAPCELCAGSRLSTRARSIRYRGKGLDEVLNLTIEEAARHYRYVPRLRLILPRLVAIGLGYLRLSQATRSLSRGEQQRLRLLPYIGRASSEGGTLLVFDEPTRGLHLDEVAKLVSLLRALVGQGNSVVVIEHNRELLEAADVVIEFGPGAGVEGGRILP